MEVIFKVLFFYVFEGFNFLQFYFYRQITCKVIVYIFVQTSAQGFMK